MQDPAIIGMHISYLNLKDIFEEIRFECDTLVIDLRMMTVRTDQLFATNRREVQTKNDS